jgi:hypothetical protein
MGIGRIFCIAIFIIDISHKYKVSLQVTISLVLLPILLDLWRISPGDHEHRSISRKSTVGAVQSGKRMMIGLRKIQWFMITTKNF